MLSCIRYNAKFTGGFFIHKMSNVVQEYNVSNILRNFRKIHQFKGLAVVETGLAVRPVRPRPTCESQASRQ